MMSEDELKLEREKLELERFKAIAEQRRFILGSVVVALITVFASHTIQSREVAVKERESERLEIEQLGKYIDHALSENVATRERFARYFWRVSRSKDLKQGWENYLGDVLVEKKKVEANVIDLLAAQADLARQELSDSIHRAQLRELKEKLRKAEAQLEVNRIAPSAQLSSHGQIIRGEALGGTGVGVASGTANLTTGSESR
ncbi:hypothetical protein ACLIKD_14070 [Azonexus sp. IMCC34842]|uniref:hypothetical protein n=1 Tax=Azonexus sp. IMCC34842 TaxID=3420950 RepID=UPI003D0D834C